jgi:hypothetical protein
VSYFLAFLAADDDASPEYGDDVATNSGTLALMEYAATLDASAYPQLSAWGDDCSSDDPAALESELIEVIGAKPNDPDGNVLHTLQVLLAGARQRPDDAVALVLTDGTDPDDDDEVEGKAFHPGTGGGNVFGAEGPSASLRTANGIYTNPRGGQGIVPSRGKCPFCNGPSYITNDGLSCPNCEERWARLADADREADQSLGGPMRRTPSATVPPSPFRDRRAQHALLLATGTHEKVMALHKALSWMDSNTGGALVGSKPKECHCHGECDTCKLLGECEAEADDLCERASKELLHIDQLLKAFDGELRIGDELRGLRATMEAAGFGTSFPASGGAQRKAMARRVAELEARRAEILAEVCKTCCNLPQCQRS